MRREVGRDPNRSVSYRKPVVQISTGSMIKQGLLGFGYKIGFAFGGAVNKFQNLISNDPNAQFYILGKSLHGFDEAKEFYCKIIWFTYRRIPGLSLSTDLHSDSGWGCLIRVGQMVMAASLKRFLLNKNTDVILESKIIISFLENNGSKQEKYSLRKIVQRTKRKNEKVNYGTWFTCSMVCSALVDLHRKDRLAGTQNLELHLFQHQTILISEIFQKLGKKLCSCKKKKILCQTCLKEDFSMVQEQRKPIETLNSTMFQSNSKKRQNISKNQSDLPYVQQKNKVKTKGKSVVIFIICQMGFDKPNKKSIQQLKELFELESSLGALGGIPKKGLFITGFEGDNFIYLDPHLTQQKVEVNRLARQMKTFYPQELRRKEFCDLDPSIALAFYIDSLQSLRKLQQKSEKFQENYDSPIFHMEWDNSYLRNSVYEQSEVDPREFDNDNDLENSFIDEQ